MIRIGRVWLVCVLAGWGVAACDDGVHQYDDIPTPQGGAISPADEEDAGVADAGDDEFADDDRPTRRPASSSRSSDGDDNGDDDNGDDDNGDDDNGDDDNGDDDNGDDDNGDDDNGDDDDDNGDDDDDNGDDDTETDPDLPPVAGTAEPAGCYSYTTPSDGMCGSHYCGVTEAQLRAEIPEDSVCGDPEFACTGNLVTVAGACARRIKGNMPFASNEALRPSIVSCVNEDPEIAQRVSSGCLDCFLDALDCISQACLTDCLNGDSPQCDRCGRNAGCFDPVYSCGGLPDPY
jgi:hypothetical protein